MQRRSRRDSASLDLAATTHTLGDPVRLEIVRALADDRPRLCGEIAELVELPTSTSSYQLKLLREAGITLTRAEATKRLISLRRDDLDEPFPGLVDVITH